MNWAVTVYGNRAAELSLAPLPGLRAARRETDPGHH